MAVAIETLPALLDSYITTTHDAMTIARRTCIGTQVIDARIIAATTSAAHWYGVEHPEHLLGYWISLVHHPDDARLGRMLSLARHCGLKAPTAYVSRIRDVQTPGIFRPVMKDTMQAVVEGESYWITVLSEPRTRPLALQPEVLQRFAVPDAARATQFYGQMSVADMEAVLTTSAPQPHAAVPLDTPPLPPLLALDLGASVALTPETYAHRCARCAAVWVTPNPAPLRCGKRTCQTPAWRTLSKSLRNLQHDGIPITPAMVRTARQSRAPRRQRSHR